MGTLQPHLGKGARVPPEFAPEFAYEEEHLLPPILKNPNPKQNEID
jgi:hypothetical protein